MAKSRFIKPETWTDAKFVALDPLARLLFIGMWNYACDNGHLDDSPLQLRMRVLPADNCDASELLEQIVSSGMVVRENGYLKVVNLARKQTPDLRFLVFCNHCENDPERRYHAEDKKSTQRAPAGNTTSAPRAHDESPESARRNVGVGVGVDVDSDLVRAASRPRASRRSPETPLPDDWQPTDKHREYVQAHRLDLDREVFKFRNHAAANDRRQRNWNATFTTWLANATEFAARNGVPANTGKPRVQQWLDR